MNRLVNRLLEQLKSDNAIVRATTIRTLKELGVKKDMIIQAILPMLADPDVSTRRIALKGSFMLKRIPSLYSNRHIYLYKFSYDIY